MISADTQIILSSGEAISASEVFEGLARLASAAWPYPLLSEVEKTRAMLLAGLDALEWAKENGVM